MKDYRFYLEFSRPSLKARSGRAHIGHVGNIFALDVGSPPTALFGAGAILSEPNSPVTGTGVSRDWLRRYAKRISEATARQIHPRLFEWLDSFEGSE